MDGNAIVNPKSTINRFLAELAKNCGRMRRNAVTVSGAVHSPSSITFFSVVCFKSSIFYPFPYKKREFYLLFVVRFLIVSLNKKFLFLKFTLYVLREQFFRRDASCPIVRCEKLNLYLQGLHVYIVFVAGEFMEIQIIFNNSSFEVVRATYAANYRFISTKCGW